MSKTEAEIWILADDRAGNRSQVLGVASYLQRPFTIKDLTYGPLVKVPNQIMPPSFSTLDSISRKELVEPWPNLIIAAGRRTAGIARRIKKLSSGDTRLVQIMNPGGSTKDFDLLCVPTHDPPVFGSNIIQITGAPHTLTPERLASARKRWMPQLEDITPPRIALIVGGSTRRRKFTHAMAENLARSASAMANNMGGSLLLATSRRTAEIEKTIMNGLSAPRKIFKWGDKAENPYIGYLACADMIIVTGDSISMCTEACASNVPVFVFAPPELVSPKHGRFHKLLFEGGFAQDLASGAMAQPHLPLNPGKNIAEAIHRIMEW